MQGLEISGTVEGCGSSSLKNNWVTVKVVNVSFRNDTTFVDNYTKNLEKKTYENLEKLVIQRIVHGVTFLWINYEQLRDEIFRCIYNQPLKDQLGNY